MIHSSFAPFYETEVPQDELIVSRTDTTGIITYANNTFASISGYAPEELIGKSHRIIRHPDMPKSIFKELWSAIIQGKIWSGYVKNRRKDGGYYWVYAEISPLIQEGKIVEYKSMRSFVPKEKRQLLQDSYDRKRKEEEDRIQIHADISSQSYALLNKELNQNELTLDAWLLEKLHNH